MTKRVWLLLAFSLGIVSTAAVIFAMNHRRATQMVPEYVLTYAENQAEDYPTTRAAYHFADMVYQRTDGKIKIQVHAEAALGNEISVVEQVQFGGIDFTRVSLSTLSPLISQLSVLQMPYLYEDSEHMWEVLDGEMGQEFMAFFEGSGMVPLSWFDAGARCFYTTDKPVEKLEDLAGLKIRVQESSLLEDMILALGAEPVPMPFDQVYSALETGEIDGAENNWPSYDSTRHNEVAKYFTVDEHSRIPEIQMISKQTWDKLPKEYQAIISQCALESARYERRLWKEQERLAKRNVMREGCVEILLSPEEKLKFKEAVEPVYEEYCGDYMDMVDRIRALGAKKQEK